MQDLFATATCRMHVEDVQRSVFVPQAVVRHAKSSFYLRECPFRQKDMARGAIRSTMNKDCSEIAGKIRPVPFSSSVIPSIPALTLRKAVGRLSMDVWWRYRCGSVFRSPRATYPPQILEARFKNAAVRAAQFSLSRPRRLARPRTPPFHGDNTGSNPVGDANRCSSLELFITGASKSGDSTGTNAELLAELSGITPSKTVSNFPTAPAM